MVDFESVTHLTFDCYGTLIDWESGILAAVRPVLERHGKNVADDEILRSYARHEAEQEQGPYKPYRDVLSGVMAAMASDLGFRPSPSDLGALPDSVGRWPPFPDTVESLARLKKRYKLVILSNVDDDLFAETARHLRVDFDEVVTARQVGAYKPSRENFRVALARLGVPRRQVLHVAQSLYHDHVPAKELGWATVWVNRKSLRPGTGVAPAAEVVPDLEVPDLAGLVEAMGL
jgi:2-haloacid dehalogenase